MRIATLALLVTITVPATAQEPVPDTTAPWRYFPLDNGNRWEYLYYNLSCPVWTCPQEPRGYMRWIADGDSLIGGTVFRRLREEWFDLDMAPTDRSVRYVRYDSTARRVWEWTSWSGSESAFEFAPCPLDQPFSANEECDNAWWDWWYAGGTYDYDIGNGVHTAVKWFAWYSIGRYVGLAADVGLFLLTDDKVKSFERYELLYARTASLTYGAPVLPPPVADEPRPPETSLRLAVAPSPSVGPLTLTLQVPTAGVVVVEAFDALGRRVHQTRIGLPVGSHTLPIDAGPWRPGLYILRATAGGVNVSARAVRR